VNAWVPVIVQIGLGLATIVGSGVVVYGLNTRKEQQQFLRSKLESVFEAVVSLERKLGLRMGEYGLVIDQKVQFEEAYTIKRETRTSAFEYYVKIEMLISLYFPDLLPKYGELKELRLTAARLEERIERSVKANADLSEFRQPYLAIYNSFKLVVQALKIALRQQGQKLGLLDAK
jgi:hypothetical protein